MTNVSDEEHEVQRGELLQQEIDVVNPRTIIALLLIGASLPFIIDNLQQIIDDLQRTDQPRRTHTRSPDPTCGSKRAQREMMDSNDPLSDQAKRVTMGPRR